MSSTVAVYSRIPELKESRIPDVMLAVADDMASDARAPSPMAIPRGVMIEYSNAPPTGTHESRAGIFKKARRLPKPRPSNISEGSSGPD